MTVFLFNQFSPVLFFPFMLLWGAAAAADSPQFSAMVASNAEPTNKGTALTMVTCIGFAITIISIQWLSKLIEQQNNLYAFLLLAPGPIWGLIAMRRLLRKSKSS